METIRCVGMLLIAGSSVALGFGAALRVRMTVSQLHRLDEALEQMRCELQYKMTPLSESLKHTAATSKGAIQQLLRNASQQIAANQPPQKAMQLAIAQTKTLRLPQEILFVLLELGQNLGQFDLEGQLSMLQMSQKRIQTCIERYEMDYVQRCKSYQALGICTAAALIILMA